GAGTSVSPLPNSTATLELEVETNPASRLEPDPHSNSPSPGKRDLWNDSITGLNGNGPQAGLRISEGLTINGTGVANVGGLHSLSGINRWLSAISLPSVDAGIGVEPDPNASNSNIYFTNDYSLTISGNIAGGGGTIFHKEDAGQLILPFSNT